MMSQGAMLAWSNVNRFWSRKKSLLIHLWLLQGKVKSVATVVLILLGITIDVYVELTTLYCLVMVVHKSLNIIFSA